MNRSFRRRCIRKNAFESARLPKRHRRIIKESDSCDDLIMMFNRSLSKLNKYFDKITKFDAAVGSVYRPSYWEIYPDDDAKFLLGLHDLIKSNPDCVIYNYIREYLSNPVYLAVIKDKDLDYIEKYISDGRSLDDVDYDTFNQWYKEFSEEVLELDNEIAGEICGYLSDFEDIIDQADSEDTADDFYEWIIH